MDILYLIKTLLKRFWLIFGVTFFAAAVTAFYTIKAPDQYKSTAQLSTGFTIKGSIELGAESFNIREADAKFNNLIEQINSPLIIGILSYHLLIHDLSNEQPFRQLGAELKSEFKLDEAKTKEIINILSSKISNIEILSSFDENEVEILELLKEYEYDDASIRSYLSIRRINYTDYVTISGVTEHPFLSAFLVNTLSTEYIRYNNTINSERTSESVLFFEKLAYRKKQDLDEISTRLKSYKSSNQFLNFDVESEAKINQIKEYEALVEQEEYDLSSLRFSLDLLNDRLRGSASSITNEDLTSQINQLKSEIAQKNKRYQDGGSRNSVLADSLGILNNQLNQLYSKRAVLGNEIKQREELQNEKSRLEVDIQIAEKRLESISSKLRSLRTGVAVFAGKEATISSLQRELDIASQEYLDAQNKLNFAKNASLVGNDAIEQILKGQPAIRRESAKLLLKTALSGVMGFALCTFVIIFIEYIDLRIKTTARFERTVGLKLIGIINNLGSKTIDFGSLFKHSDKQNTEKDTLVHSLRKLRFEITSQTGKIILVTSLNENEGKSFTIKALTSSLGLIDKKVLIIDTNFRNNTLSNPSKTDKNPKKNPKEIKGEDRKIDNIFEKAPVTFTDNKNIFLIRNNGGHGSPSEILAGKNFYTMVKNVSLQYDYIFIEGPSLNDYSDTYELSEFSDKILLVFDAQNTVGQRDKESIKFLVGLNEKFVGAILNKVKIENLDKS